MAHLMPPFADQGMNSGLLDGHNLAYKLAQASVSQNATSLLDSYEMERRPHTLKKMITFAHRMGQMTVPNSIFQGAILGCLLHVAKIIPSGARMFFQMKFKLMPRFGSNMIWPD